EVRAKFQMEDDSVEEKTDADWGIYPNPADQQVTIETDFLGVYEMQLFDAQGRIVFAETSNQSRTIMQVSHLTPGVYVLNITNDQGILTRQKMMIK
ncbi:MAG: T9SS type A sorting domain-containing protein, partial [Flavobacteriales bacterium]